ncbi:uncharacterized protein FIBRA_01734 [Fibroporia radiculosa]|uniref:Chromatin modification-related protein EAF7 n=1 Tax=Fibroporia radiculosa TaxID=599839 RepID=J4HTT3_9APHY|nr:uncharacterized protein FIBRA_01734 [Fibroporia radiculosa]CCL99712.1 predicted protein [Fibroporia radiculosa]
MSVVNDAGTAGNHFLDTVEGEIALFRSVMRARPVGLHRHFHVLTICNAILRDTGHSISIDDVWKKLRSCYNLDVLENIEVEGYDPPGSQPTRLPTDLPVRSPSPGENLFSHPWFRHEYSLPSEEHYESLIAVRRMRATASLPSSSPAQSPSAVSRPGPAVRETRKGRSKLKNMAGLVGGDSDSSALTQESGDESAMPTPSLATGTDAGTDYAEEEDPEGRESPGLPLATKLTRKTTKPTRRGGGGRGRGGSTAGGRGTKRKKK